MATLFIALNTFAINIEFEQCENGDGNEKKTDKGKDATLGTRSRQAVHLKGFRSQIVMF